VGLGLSRVGQSVRLRFSVPRRNAPARVGESAARHGVWIGPRVLHRDRRASEIAEILLPRGWGRNAVFRAAGASASRRSHDPGVLRAKSGRDAGTDVCNESPCRFTSSPYGRHRSYGTGRKVSSVTRSNVAACVMLSGAMWLFVIATAHRPWWLGAWHRRSDGPVVLRNCHRRPLNARRPARSPF
jgi:hypothetical protein